VRAVLGAGDHGQPGGHGAALGDVVGDRTAQLGILIKVEQEVSVGPAALPGGWVSVQRAGHDQPPAGDGIDAEKVAVSQGPAGLPRLDSVVVAGADDQVPRAGRGAVGDGYRGAGLDQAEAHQVVADPAGQLAAQGVVGGHQQGVRAVQDRHPVPQADRAEHFRRASIAFAAHGGPGARSAVTPPAAELADLAYAEPLLIHIAALLRTAPMSATPAPGMGDGPAPGKDLAAGKGRSARKGLLRALCERERTRWHELGAGSGLAFNPDLPLADQVVALATLTAAADPASATSLLAALPNQAEVTRIGAEALAAWAHRLYAGPGYWNPLRPDLLAEQHLADTPQLPALAIAAARLAAGQDWETGVLTQLLAELTRGAPNQPAVRVALDELLAAALPRIVGLAITSGPAELADLASLALQLAPQPALVAPLAEQMPEHSVRLAALAATLTSQQVTQYRAGARGAEPDAANRLAGSPNDLAVRLADLGRREEALAASQEAAAIRRELAAARPDAFRPVLAGSLNNLSSRLADLRRREEALAAIQEAVTIRRELAARWPDAYQHELEQSLRVIARFEKGEDLSDASPWEPKA
jgi:hypothetical protein